MMSIFRKIKEWFKPCVDQQKIEKEADEAEQQEAQNGNQKNNENGSCNGKQKKRTAAAKKLQR